MNEILQKRIEEAAFQESSMYNTIQEKNAAYSTGMKIASFALQNQWISVEEALPEEKYLVLTRVKTPVGIVYRSDYYINDYWYMCRYNQEEIITHWALIPSLKVGEK